MHPFAHNGGNDAKCHEFQIDDRRGRKNWFSFTLGVLAIATTFAVKSMTRFDISWIVLCSFWFSNSFFFFSFRCQCNQLSHSFALTLYCWCSCDFATVVAASLYAIDKPFVFFQLRIGTCTASASEALPIVAWEHDLRLSLTRLFDLS